MSAAEDAYKAFLIRCHALGIKAPMSAQEYEKFVAGIVSIPSDRIIERPKKDKT